MERTREFGEEQADRDVNRALDVLDAKHHAATRKDEPITANQLTARDRLYDAITQVQEVSFKWDDKARGLVTEARDLLRDDTAVSPDQIQHKAALEYCDKAITSIEEHQLRDRMKENFKKSSARQALQKDQNKDRERD